MDRKVRAHAVGIDQGIRIIFNVRLHILPQSWMTKYCIFRHPTITQRLRRVWYINYKWLSAEFNGYYAGPVIMYLTVSLGYLKTQ